MVKQKTISFKIDDNLLPLLDMLCGEYGLKRNNMLNVLVRTGVHILSDKRVRFGILAAMEYSSKEFNSQVNIK